MSVVTAQPNGCAEWGAPGPVTEADVRRSITIAREHGQSFFAQIMWQIENEAWTKVGYASWDEMWDTEYQGIRVVVERSERPELVARGRDAGLSQEQMAKTFGVDQGTVSRDLNRQMADEKDPNMQKHIETPTTTTRTNSRGQERPASYAAKPKAPVTEPPPEPATDPPAKPRKTNRKPLPKQFDTAGWELRKAIERLERLTADDRFDTNKEAVAPHLRGHLTNAIEVCQDLLDRLN